MLRIAFFLTLGLLAAITWLRVPLANPVFVERLEMHRVLAAAESEMQRRQPSPFRLEGVWHMQSPHDWFGGYSALVALPQGHLLAFSDSGYSLGFAPPGTAVTSARFADMARGSIAPGQVPKTRRDAESAYRDPLTGQVWIGWEGRNAISRHAPDLSREAIARPAAMRGWMANTGPEAMTRLADGRFVALSEGYADSAEGRRHSGVLFDADPADGARGSGFTFLGPRHFRPTDMAQMPDGRVLVLMRRVVWPLPPRFAALIAIADPAELKAGREWRAQPVAWLSAALPVDNLEGMAIAPQRSGRLAVWLISDNNHALTQRTLLWRLTVDPAMLPGRANAIRRPASSPARASP